MLRMVDLYITKTRSSLSEVKTVLEIIDRVNVSGSFVDLSSIRESETATLQSMQMTIKLTSLTSVPSLL